MALSRKRHQLYWLERGRAQNRPLPCCLLILIFCFVFIANPTVYCLLFPSPEKLWPSNNIFIWDTLNSRRDIVFVWSLSQVYCSLPFKLHTLDITPTTTMTMLPHATTAIFQLNTGCDCRVRQSGNAAIVDMLRSHSAHWRKRVKLCLTASRSVLCCAMRRCVCFAVKWNMRRERSKYTGEKKNMHEMHIYSFDRYVVCVCRLCGGIYVGLCAINRSASKLNWMFEIVDPTAALMAEWLWLPGLTRPMIIIIISFYFHL